MRPCGEAGSKSKLLLPVVTACSYKSVFSEDDSCRYIFLPCVVVASFVVSAYASFVCCRYGSSSEDVDMGRWVAHAEEKHNIKVKFIENHETFYLEEEWQNGDVNPL